MIKVKNMKADRPAADPVDGLLTEWAYRRIEELIVTLQLPSGQVLSESELIEELGIGRTRVREALQRLAFEGLVVIMPRRGVLVSEINHTKQLALPELRCEVERLVMRRAAGRTTDEERAIFATTYYTATKAMIEALNAVDGDLWDGQAAFRETLSTMELAAPTGTVTLDDNRNGIANNFPTEVVEGTDGNLQNQLIKVIPEVNQTLGFPRDDLLALGAVGRDVPSCN